MTDHKFTDEQIIHSLEVCSSNGDCKECDINPNRGNFGYCTSLALKAALDLINRQKAEIERLRKYYFTHDYHECHNEAIKEFVERLRECAYDLRYYDGERVSIVEAHCIDRVAKEMKEGKT